MMKALKKVLAVLVALITAFALFALAACDEKDDPDASVPTTPVTPGNPSQPSNPDEPSTPDPEPDPDPVGPVQTTVAAILEKARNQEITSVEYATTLTSEDDIKYYKMNGAQKGEEITSRADSYHDVIRHCIKGNVATGDLDFLFYQTTTYGNGDPSDYVWYEFLRDWNLFDVDGQIGQTGTYGEITDFSGKTLNYTGKAQNGIPFDTEIFGGMSALTEIAFRLENYTIISLADAFGALTVSEGQAVINVNTLLYNGVNAVYALIDSLNDNTTVGQLFENRTFKAIVSAIVDPIPVELMPDVLKTAIEASGFNENLDEYGIALSDILVEPAEGISSYQYLLQLINSEELRVAAKKIIDEMTGDNFPLDVPVSMATVKFVATVVSEMIGDDYSDINDLKAMLRESIDYYIGGQITQTSYTYSEVWSDNIRDNFEDEGTPVELTESYTVTDAVITYALDGADIVGQRLTADISHGHQQIETEPDDLFAYIMREGLETMRFDCTVGYPETEFELENINGCATELIDSEYDEELGETVRVKYLNTVAGILAGEEGTRVVVPEE